MDETPLDAFLRGRSLLEAGDWAHALGAFERAHALEPSSARFRSFYGLCFGVVERRFQESSELCASAAKQEFFNPDMYLNLARLYLSFGFKSEGVRFLRRGRMIAPGHAEISAELHRLGQRSQPVLAFLPRRHILNRCCGLARQAFARPQPELAA